MVYKLTAKMITNFLNISLSIVIATFINFSASKIAGHIAFPLFMDSISTIAVAAIFGTIPAIIVAILSNGLLAIFATTAFPFLLCHVMTAVFSGLIFRAEKKKNADFNLSVESFMWAGLASAISNSALGDTFSLVLFYGNTNIPQIDNTVQGIFIATQNMPFAIYWGGTLANLIDKILCALFSSGVYFFVARKTAIGIRRNKSAVSVIGNLLYTRILCFANYAIGIVGARSVPTEGRNGAKAEPRIARPADRQESPIFKILKIEYIFLFIAIVNLVATGIFKSRANDYFASLDISAIDRIEENRVRFGFDCMIYSSLVLIFIIVLLALIKYFSERESFSRLKMQTEIQEKISRDVHDSTLQNLGAMKMQLRIGRIEEGLFYAEQAVNDVRFLCGSLKLDLTKDITMLVREELKLLEMNYNLQTLFYDASDGVKKFGDEDKLELFRIINELLNNAAHHAQAKTISVKMIDALDDIIIRIEDDGIGFDFESAKEKPNHHGIENVIERVKKLGGTIEWNTNSDKSSHSKGTHVEIKLKGKAK